MKIHALRFSLLTFLLTALSPPMAFAQTPVAPAKDFFLVLLKRPANAPQLSPEAGEKLQAAHLANITKLHDEKKLFVAGPFLDDQTLRGIFILKAESKQQAQDWAISDPAVEAGRLAAELHGPLLIKQEALRAASTPQSMEQYTFALMFRTEKFEPASAIFQEVRKAHLAQITKLTEDGTIALASRIGDNENLGGIIIFSVGSEQAAKLVAELPLVHEGYLKPDLHPWATAKGVLPPGQPLH
jgi:uncharacterized protein